MPAVLDTHELLEHVETHDLHIEKPLARRSHPGFWRTLAHGITKHLTPMPHEWQAPSCSPRRPFETPADLLARQYPTLYLRAICGIKGPHPRLSLQEHPLSFGAPGEHLFRIATPLLMHVTNR